MPKDNRARTSASLALVCLIATAALSIGAATLRNEPTWAIQTRIEPDAQAGGWFINLGITGARGKIEVETPTVIDVTYIFKNTPADTRLKVGDRIVGAGAAAFSTPHKFGYGMEVFGYEGPMMDLGNALEAAQSDHNGTLALSVLRDNKPLTIELPVGTKYGAYGKDYPFNCPKTDLVLDELCATLATRQREDGYWSRGRAHIDAFAALALLAHDRDKYHAQLERTARAFAAATDDSIEYDGLDCWKYTLYGTFLAEYYLATKQDWLIPELDEINRWLDKAQMSNGGWGHRPADRPGGNGYGAFAAMTAQGMLAWSLMIRCGIEVDRTHYTAAHQFLQRGTNSIGYLWYADEIGHPTNYADMGRTGASAIAHLLAPQDMLECHTLALKQAKCIGDNPATFPDTHGSPILGLAFTALGAGADPASFRKLLDANRWHFSLAQCPDRTFYYQPNRDNNPQDYQAAPRLSATAATALVLSMKHGNLHMTRQLAP